MRPAPKRPIRLAGGPYRPSGLALDFEQLTGTVYYKTLLLGRTYYLPNNYYVSFLTVQPACVVKYNLGSYLCVLNGSAYFPDTAQTPVFTAATDDGFGEDIDGQPGSTPTFSASPVLWLYYPSEPTEIKNLRIRYAQQGITFTRNTLGVHQVRSSLFESSYLGIYYDSYTILNLTEVKKHDVQIPLQGSGVCYGSMTDVKFYTDKNFAGMNNSFDDDYYPVADTMGAVGPNHFVELLNGKIAVFNKSNGQRVEETNSLAFFTISGEWRDMIDGRILYDHEGQHWVACAIDRGNNNVVLAVSISDSPLGGRIGGNMSFRLPTLDGIPIM